MCRDTGTGACGNRQGLSPSSQMSDEVLPSHPTLPVSLHEPLCGHWAAALKETFSLQPQHTSRSGEAKHCPAPSLVSTTNSPPVHPSCSQNLRSTPEVRGWLGPHCLLGSSQRNGLGAAVALRQILLCFTCQALLCLPDCWKRYPRRNPSWKSSHVPHSSAVSQRPLAVFRGDLSAAAGGNLALPPAPSPQCPFQTGDLLCPDFQKQIQTVFLSSFHV